MSNYFLSYGTKVNEYQIWKEGHLKCRHPTPRGILEYMQLEKKIEVDINIIGVGGLGGLAQKIMAQLREPRATAETSERLLKEG